MCVAQVPRRRGQDPAADQQDKALARLATKGVVRLFNAIAKAQKQLREAEEATGSRAQAVKLGKASFLAQLKRSSGVRADGQPDQPLVPSAPARQQGAAAAAAAPAAGKKQQQQQRRAAAAADSSSEDEDAGGWDVLKQGFVGLQGGEGLGVAWAPAGLGLSGCHCCAASLGCSGMSGACIQPPSTHLPLCCWACRRQQNEGLGQAGER